MSAQKHFKISDTDWEQIVASGTQGRFEKYYQDELGRAKRHYERFVGKEIAESDYRAMAVMEKDLLPDTLIFDILDMYRELAMANSIFPEPEEPPTEGEFDRYGNRQVYP